MIELHNDYTGNIIGQSYKDSMIINYDSRGVPDQNIAHITTLDSLFTIVNCL